MTFIAEPDNAFTTEDLCDRAYPGVTHPLRKHRAAVIPARSGCASTSANIGIGGAAKRGVGHHVLEPESVMSYAMARLKSDWLECYESEVGAAPQTKKG